MHALFARKSVITGWICILLVAASQTARSQPTGLGPGGGVSTGVTDEMARSAGPGHVWQGGPADVNPYSLAKFTEIDLFDWPVRGGKRFSVGVTHCSISAGATTGTGVGGKWKWSTLVTMELTWGDDNWEATVSRGDGSVRRFEEVGGAWTPTDGYSDSLDGEYPGDFVYETSTGSSHLLEWVSGKSDPIRYREKAVTVGGTTAMMSYTAGGQLREIMDDVGRSINMSFSAGRLATMEFRVNGVAQRTWGFGYSGGKLSTITLPPVTTDFGVQSFSYQFTTDSRHNLTSITDPDGRTTSFGYTGDRLAWAQWPGNVASERVLYSLTGNTRTVSDPLGRTTRYEYDTAGRLTSVQDPSGASTQFEFGDPDHAYRVSKVTAPSGDTYRYDYDARGNMLRSTDAAGNSWDFAYDAQDNLVQVQAPLVTDAWGMTEPARRRTEYVYDGGGRVTLVRQYTDAVNSVATQYAYDPQGNLVAVINALGATWLFERDSYGNLVRATTPMGRQVLWHYDSAALTAGFTTPNAWTDGTGVRTELVNDEWGRLRKRNFVSEPDQDYRYDAVGRHLRTVGSEGVTTYGYDAQGRLTSTSRGAYSNVYTYDAAGQRLSLTETAASGSRTLTYGYDARGLVTSISDGGPVNLFAYDSTGRLVQRTLGNGSQTLLSYANGRLVNVTQNDSSQGSLIVANYGYQADGALATITELGGATERRGYDFLGRLMREVRVDGNVPFSFTWSYDAVGRRTSQDWDGSLSTYAYDLDDRLTAVTSQQQGEQYTYDANGRIVRRVRGQEDVILASSGLGRIASVERWNGTQYVPFSRYTYDALGRTFSRAHESPGSSRSYEFWYDGTDLLRADRVANAVPTVQLATWGAGTLVRLQHSASPSGYVVSDGLGDLRKRTNAQGLDAGTTAVYNAFGQAVSVQGPRASYGFGADYGWRSEVEVEIGLERNPASGFYDASHGMAVPQNPLSGIRRYWPQVDPDDLSDFITAFLSAERPVRNSFLGMPGCLLSSWSLQLPTAYALGQVAPTNLRIASNMKSSPSTGPGSNHPGTVSTWIADWIADFRGIRMAGGPRASNVTNGFQIVW